MQKECMLARRSHIIDYLKENKDDAWRTQFTFTIISRILNEVPKMAPAATPEMCIIRRVSFPERVKSLNAHDNASDFSTKCALWHRIWRNMHIQGKTNITCLLRNYRSRAFNVIKSCRAAIWWHLLGTGDLKHVRSVPVNQVLFKYMQVSALDFFVWTGYMWHCVHSCMSCYM